MQGAASKIQGTGEEKPFTRSALLDLLNLGEIGNKRLITMQKEILSDIDEGIIIDKQVEKR